MQLSVRSPFDHRTWEIVNLSKIFENDKGPLRGPFHGDFLD